MLFANLRTVRLHYDLAGPAEAPVVVLSNSLGTNFTIWDAQASALSQQYRVLRYDTRGHGESSLPAGPHTIAVMGRDVLDLLDYLAIVTASFCGISMGAMTGLWLARYAPERIQKLIACSAAVKFGTNESWDARIDLVRREGMKAIAPGILERWFTPAFHGSSPETVATARRMLESAPIDGYIAGCAAVRGADLRAEIAAIRLPTLVATGSSDPVTSPADGHSLVAQIPGARYVELPGAHLFNVEAAADFTAEAVRFLSAP